MRKDLEERVAIVKQAMQKVAFGESPRKLAGDLLEALNEQLTDTPDDKRLLAAKGHVQAAMDALLGR